MGLTYRGKHSLRDFGMQTKINDLPITPPKKTDYEEDIPYSFTKTKQSKLNFI